MIVEIVKNGTAVIQVHDDSYIAKSRAEIQDIIDDYCRCVAEALQKQNKDN